VLPLALSLLLLLLLRCLLSARSLANRLSYSTPTDLTGASRRRRPAHTRSSFSIYTLLASTGDVPSHLQGGSFWPPARRYPLSHSHLGAAILGRHCFSALTFISPALPCSRHRPGDIPDSRVLLRSNGHSRRPAYITSVLTPDSTASQPLIARYSFETCIPYRLCAGQSE
jgi:hypothetical protein